MGPMGGGYIDKLFLYKTRFLPRDAGDTGV